MATINSVLQERVTLVAGAGGDDVYFSVPTVSQSVVPNALKIQPLEEVYINCDISAGGLNLFFPSISDFGNFWNTKVYISIINGFVGPGNTVTLYPYFGSESPYIAPNTLNGFNFLTFNTNFDAYYLHIVDSLTWISLYCPGPAL